jgi:hypothetical protein
MLGAVFAPFGAPLRNEETAADRGLEKVNGQFRAMASMTTCVSIPPWKSPANDQWCAQSCDRAGLKTAHCSATICKCGGDELKTAPDGQAAQAAPAGESEQEEGRIVCERYVSTREDTPDSWCTSYCATDEGCPDDVGDVCKCGDDIQMTDEEKLEDAELKEHFKNAEHDFTTTWTEEQEAVKRRQEQEGQEGAEARDQRDRVLKQQEDLMHARRGMQQAAEAATRGAEGQSPFDVAHGGGAAPDAAVQQPQQQQSVFEKEERRAQEQALQPQDVPMHIIKERQQQQEVDSGFPMCVSISMDKTNEWCAKACSTDAGCQGDAKKACKCGDEAIENLDKASEATAAREAAAAQANAEALAKGINDSAESAQQSAQQGGALPQPAAMPLPVDNTKYCPEMTEITADQLRCVFNMLDMGRAEMYASAATSKLGGEHGTLTTACEWAAFLGNAAIESKELTIWKEIEVLDRARPPRPLPPPPMHSHDCVASLALAVRNAATLLRSRSAANHGPQELRLLRRSPRMRLSRYFG